MTPDQSLAELSDHLFTVGVALFAFNAFRLTSPGTAR